MTVSIIVAMSENRVIGLRNRLPWRLPGDLARFKQITLGHTLVMGRKTFESIGRPLPGRTMIVVTRGGAFAPEGVRVAHSVGAAMQLASKVEGPTGEVFVAGGGEIYSQTLPSAQRIYLTLVRGRFDGDTFFPQLDPAEWHLISREDRKADDRNPHSFSFQILERTGLAGKPPRPRRQERRESVTLRPGTPRVAPSRASRTLAPLRPCVRI